MPHKRVQIQHTGIFFSKNSSVKNASHDSDTSYIDFVDDVPQDGMVFEGHTLSVNNCYYYWITDDEETDEIYIVENTWDSRIIIHWAIWITAYKKEFKAYLCDVWIMSQCWNVGFLVANQMPQLAVVFLGTTESWNI